MKHLVAIFLSVLLLFSIVACNVAHITEDTSNNINDTSYTYESIIDEPAHANPEHYANFSSYNEIIRTYKAIVKCFNYYTVEEYQNGEYRSTLDFPSDEIEEIYKKIFFSAFYYYKDDYTTAYLDDGRNYFGYALYDINGNGSDELILLNDRLDIIAIFTNFDGTPKLIIDNEPYCRIDSSGKIYTQEIIIKTHDLFPWSDRYYDMKIYTLTETDELALVEEYIADNSYGSDQMFFNVTGDQAIEATKDEFLAKTHGYLYNSDAARITQSSIEFDFVRLFEAITPILPDGYVWQWQKSKYEDSSIVLINHMTDTEVYIGLYFGKWIHITNVTATLDGEKAYFESEILSGRLEFGLDCIWIVITESKCEELPCGAYIYEYYETHK